MGTVMRYWWKRVLCRVFDHVWVPMYLGRHFVWKCIRCGAELPRG